jgi:hypothetical protein
MDDSLIPLLRELIVEALSHCTDVELLDLVYKLLIK